MTERPTANAIINALPAALFVVDSEACIRDVNASAENLFNTSATQMLGKPLGRIMDLPPSFATAQGAIFAAYDIEMATRRAGRFRADFHASPLADHPGWRLISVNAGAGAHHRGNRLERRSGGRTAVAVAAMLAHEIKNPLSGIRGAAQLLEAHVGEADAAMTRLIRSEVDRVAALIDRMQDFTDTRKVTLAPENIYAIIDHARRVIEQGYGQNVAILEDYDPSLPPVLVHRDSLIQIVLNLLKNAAETADPGIRRRIRLTTAYRHGVSVAVGENGNKLALPIELCVIDDGPGVRADIADQLFEPFVSSRRAGRGLGLALVDKLVRDMGGIVQYAREGSPEQTVFRLMLQRATGAVG